MRCSTIAQFKFESPKIWRSSNKMKLKTCLVVLAVLAEINCVFSAITLKSGESASQKGFCQYEDIFVGQGQNGVEESDSFCVTYECSNDYRLTVDVYVSNYYVSVFQIVYDKFLFQM